MKRCAQKPNCRIVTNSEALAGGAHNSFDIGGIAIQAVEAGNRCHDPKLCVGYIVTIDGVKLYASGDTSKTGQMESFAAMKLDYALFPADGLFNMGLSEAADCARIIGAKHNTIIHLKPGESYRKKGEKWDAPNKLIIEPGEELEIK